MKFIQKITVAFVLVGVFIIPNVGRAATSDEAYRLLLLELVEALQQQLQLLLQESALEIEGDADEHIEFGQLAQSVDVVSVHAISNVQTISRINDPLEREYFTEVFDIFPAEYGAIVERAMVFDGETSPYDAFVETVAPQHETWMFAVSDDVLSEIGTEFNQELVVHELAHLVSYNDVLGEPVPKESHCHDYFRGQGCPLENSYLADFVDQFWNSDDLDRAIDFSGDADVVYDYYSDHEHEYVSDYAATNPEEDFAESFMFFVLGHNTSQGIAADKVNFFEDFVDIQEMKDEIVNSL